MTSQEESGNKHNDFILLSPFYLLPHSALAEPSPAQGAQELGNAVRGWEVQSHLGRQRGEPSSGLYLRILSLALSAWATPAFSLFLKGSNPVVRAIEVAAGVLF